VGVGSGTNAAGGCDVDFTTSGGLCPEPMGFVASSDYMGGSVQFAYGMRASAPTTRTGILIDYNNANDSTPTSTPGRWNCPGRARATVFDETLTP
jgi:hypothetical protein